MVSNLWLSQILETKREGEDPNKGMLQLCQNSNLPHDFVGI